MNAVNELTRELTIEELSAVSGGEGKELFNFFGFTVFAGDSIVIVEMNGKGELGGYIR